MWKRLRLIIVILSILVTPFTLSQSGQAATSSEVTITAVGMVVAAPGGFTVTYISDYEVGLSWVKPAGAANVMIRAKYSDYPNEPNPGEEPTDGYLVYYGDGTYTSDTAVSLDETATPVYYKAWCETTNGQWGTLYASGEMEGIGMVLIAFVVLALGLLIAAFALSSGRKLLAFASAGAWALLGVYSYTKSASLWDVYYSLFWLAMAMTFACALIPAVLREKKEEPAVEDTDEYGDKDLLADLEASEKDRERFDKLFGPRRHRPRRRLSRFAKTGME